MTTTTTDKDAISAAAPPASNKMLDQERGDACSGDDMVGEVAEWEKKKVMAGNARFHRLGWKRLTVVLLVTAVALGSLSLPSAFATLGMVCGIFLCIVLGLIAVYTAYLVGKVKLAFPHVQHYPDAAGLMFGKVGNEIIGVMLSLLLLFLVASHCLTGTIAFAAITGSNVCTLVWGVVSAILLLLLAVPPSFAEVAILGYIDFVSIMAAIFITIIATGVQASEAEGGRAAVEWSAWPDPDAGFAEVIIAICNIFFAYSFCISQFSFMDEMHTPSDYMKSIWTLGAVEVVIYTLTGSLIYAFVGNDVQSPALLSAGTTITKVAFGVALPVIFISGSINTTVAARYIHGRIYKDSVVRYVNTKKGWITWLLVITVFTILAWVIAEAIPFFNDLVAITASLLNSGFTLYFPAMMWFMLLRKGKWYQGWNLLLSIWNAFVFILGVMFMIAGPWACVVDIIHQYDQGTLKGVFTCEPI